MIPLTLRKRTFLKTQLVINPNMAPIESETIPSKINYRITIPIVPVVNSTDYRFTKVLNKIMQTISLTIPSPNMIENNFGCFE